MKVKGGYLLVRLLKEKMNNEINYTDGITLWIYWKCGVKDMIIELTSTDIIYILIGFIIGYVASHIYTIRRERKWK